MARALILSLDGQEFPVQMQKVDRDKLYGTVELEAFDAEGYKVALQILDTDGKTLIGTGGTALATLDETGNSIDRKTLTPVTPDGEVIEPVPSSFGAPNPVSLATIDDYLSHTVKSIYILTPPEGSDFKLLEDALKGDNIYKFDFSYRGGLEYDAAFLVGNDAGVFMVIGTNTNINFVTLSQAVALDVPQEEEISGEEIEFDLL